MLGLSHASAPVEVRERVAFSGQGLAMGLSMMVSRPAILEGAILSTCNRTELYAVVSSPAEGREALKAFILEERDLPAEVFEEFFYFLEGEAAIRHLFRVSGGLESQILGEGQILSQVKDAQAAAQLHRTMGAVLDSLFRFAVTAGKRVRTETEISRGAVSVSSAAIELAKESLGGFDGKTIMILGTGKMGELAAKQLPSYNLDKIYVANRTLESAEQLAERIGGEAVPFHAMQDALEAIDMLVCSTGAPHYVLTPSEMKSVIANRDGKPLLIVDVSVPRNIDPALGDLPGITVYDVDDLQSVASKNRSERQAVAMEAEAILVAEISSYQTWLKNFRMTPTISSFRNKAHDLREQELGRFWDKHAHTFSPEQRQLVESMTQAMMNKFLHQPLTSLKGMNSLQQHHHASALQTLFDLNVEDFQEHYLRRNGERRTMPLA
jgi:glutamyl-tRNA reductase